MPVSHVAETIQSQVADKANNVIGLYELRNTPLKLYHLLESLKNYLHKDAIFLTEGLRNGFPLNYTGPRGARESPNLSSAKQHPNIMREKLIKEINRGRIAGPFSKKPFPTLQVSPVGLVAKKDGDHRMIHHLSYPDSQSINDFIEEKHCKVTYSNIDQAADLIFKLGKGALLSKTDIKSAFRLLPITPSDFELLGIKFENQYFYDKMLPMGSSASCAIWEKFACFLHWSIGEKTKSSDILHYLDDFLFGEKASEF